MKRLYFALCMDTDGRWELSRYLYESYEECKKHIGGNTFKLIWPAIPNSDGFYEVPSK